MTSQAPTPGLHGTGAWTVLRVSVAAYCPQYSSLLG
jgi:hypothetical protein